ncbi:MAG: diguanylate cyclase [Desulfurivibrionaceae bacterium]
MISNVLVIDNNPVILKMLSETLEGAGYKVNTALDGLSAFDFMLKNPPDIIFLDLVMPNINGEQLCRIIYDYDQLRDIPVVLISGVAAETNEECALEMVSASIAKGPELSKNVLEVIGYYNKEENLSAVPGQFLGKDRLCPREISLELLDANHHLRVILENMSEGILEITRERRIIFANQAASLLTGVRRELLLATDFFNLPFEGEGKYRLWGGFHDVDRESGVIGEDESLSINDHLIKLQFMPVFDRKEQNRIAILKDITARKKAEKQIRESRQYLQSVLNSVQAGILIIDVETCTVIDANPLALEMLAVSRDELTGRACHEYSCADRQGICPIVNEDNCPHTIIQHLTNGKGEQIYVLKTASSCEIGHKTYVVESLIDISEQKRLEEQLQALTITDELTGLLNRRGFMMMARKQLSIADRVKNNPFLVFADLDDFKVINDTYGHETGDRVLIKVGEVLNSLRKSDISGRLGGDEFALLVTRDRGEEKNKLVDKLQERFEQINDDIKLDIRITLSIGIVEYDPARPSSLEDLLARADSLMYRHKMSKEEG